MTDESTELRRINWSETFPFTRIFQSFKMAVHLSKLLLALAAILLILGGAWVMDRAFSLFGQRVAPGEIRAHVASTPSAFDRMRDTWENGKLDRAAALSNEWQQEELSLAGFQRQLAALVQDAGAATPRLQPALAKLPAALKKKIDEENKERVKNNDNKPIKIPTAREIAQEARDNDKDAADVLDDAEEAFDKAVERVEDFWDDVKKTALEEAKKLEYGKGKTFASEDEKDDALDLLEDVADRMPEVRTKGALRFAQAEQQITGTAIAASLFEFERDCFWNALVALRFGNFTGGLSAYRQILQGRAVPGAALPPTQDAGNEPLPPDNQCGLLFWLLMALHGLIWLVSTHWIYALIFSLFALIVWSIFGGAIYRIAAVQAAREEKISMRQALRFSFDKVLSFLSAPLIPILFLVIIGLLLSAGGLLGNIPIVGPIIMGAVFFLALIGGLLIALGAIALAGGSPLMYPTIAVEGSDSFDAMSRSISYIFQRPWHAIFYGAVAAIYGAITFLFVRLVAFVLLTATHAFVSLGIFTGGDTLGPDADKLDVLWAAPTFQNLMPPCNAAAMSGGQTIGAFLIWIWVGLVVLLALAYVPSFFASASTVIYYLLRRNVDATDLDDVYIEEIEEEEEYAPAEGAEPAPADETPAEGGQEAPAEETPADQAPAEEEPAEEEPPAEEPAEGPAEEPAEESKDEGEGEGGEEEKKSE